MASERLGEGYKSCDNGTNSVAYEGSNANEPSLVRSLMLIGGSKGFVGAGRQGNKRGEGREKTVKLQDPSLDIHKAGKYLMLSVQELVSGDQCEGRFVFGRESKKPKESSNSDRYTKDGANPKSLLQTLLMRAGHSPPKYKTKHLKTNEFRALVEFKGMQFVGKPKKNKQLAERDAAIEALAWLTQTSDQNQDEDNSSPPDVTDNMLKLLGKRRRSKRHPG
ncbi:RNA helicase [Sarracenia purpurea var. burkii]